MQTLINKNETPPGQFRFTVRETAHKFRSIAWGTLIKEIRDHYKANSLLVPLDLEAQVEDQLCSVLPPGWCNQNDPTKAHFHPAGLTMANFLTGTKTIVSWFLGGKRKASKEEIEERTRICSGCFWNQNPEGCTGCSMGAIHEVVNSVVAERYPGDQFLKACMLCGCSLVLKTRVPLDILQKHTSAEVNERLPEYCWLKKAA